MTPKFSAREAVKFAWSKIVADPWKFVGTSILFVVIQIFPIFFKNIPVLGGVAQIISMILLYMYYMGMTRIMIGVVDGRSFKVMDAFHKDMEMFLRYIGAMILYTLIVIGGFLLLIIPGIIWSLKYFLAPYLVVDQNLKPMSAIKESGKITDGQKMKIFCLLLLLVGINILGALCLLVGVLISMPVSSLALAYAYRKLVPAPTLPV